MEKVLDEERIPQEEIQHDTMMNDIED